MVAALLATVLNNYGRARVGSTRTTPESIGWPSQRGQCGVGRQEKCTWHLASSPDASRASPLHSLVHLPLPQNAGCVRKPPSGLLVGADFQPGSERTRDAHMAEVVGGYKVSFESIQDRLPLEKASCANWPLGCTCHISRPWEGVSPAVCKSTDTDWKLQAESRSWCNSSPVQRCRCNI